MAKLTLQFEGRFLKEFAVGKSVTIGRLPDNTVVIENPAVSGHHARVFRQGENVILEDLRSTNGTFVNEQHVERHTLRHGDVVLVGKHKLLFATEDLSPTAGQPLLSPLGDTLYLDTRKHRELLATLRAARADADAASSILPIVRAAFSEGRIGVLHVVGGRAERAEYSLDAQTSLIGKSRDALVRLRGWFKPEVALAIARSGEGYVATYFGGRTLVNSAPLRGRRPLREGDILSVAGLTLEFRWAREQRSTANRPGEFRGERLMSAGERAATARALT